MKVLPRGVSQQATPAPNSLTLEALPVQLASRCCRRGHMFSAAPSSSAIAGPAICSSKRFSACCITWVICRASNSCLGQLAILPTCTIEQALPCQAL